MSSDINKGEAKIQAMQIVVAGVGGQGTVLTSRILAQACFASSIPVRRAETIGMAQRGGSVVGHLRMGDCYSPLVRPSSADLLIGFEPSEALRSLKLVRRGGAVVVASAPVASTVAALKRIVYDGQAELATLKNLALAGELGKLVIVDTDAACKRIGSPKVLNVVLLAAACASGLLPFSEQMLTDILASLIKPKLVRMNLEAFAAGREFIIAEYGERGTNE